MFSFSGRIHPSCHGLRRFLTPALACSAVQVVVGPSGWLPKSQPTPSGSEKQLPQNSSPNWGENPVGTVTPAGAAGAPVVTMPGMLEESRLLSCRPIGRKSVVYQGKAPPSTLFVRVNSKVRVMLPVSQLRPQSCEAVIDAAPPFWAMPPRT